MSLLIANDKSDKLFQLAFIRRSVGLSVIKWPNLKYFLLFQLNSSAKLVSAKCCFDFSNRNVSVLLVPFGIHNVDSLKISLWVCQWVSVDFSSANTLRNDLLRFKSNQTGQLLVFLGNERIPSKRLKLESYIDRIDSIPMRVQHKSNPNQKCTN